MGLMLKRQRDGTIRGEWYGVYKERGKRTVANLGVPVDGTPPDSGRVGDHGSPEFEASRKTAKTALKSLMEDLQRKGRAEHLTERLIESKTGRRLQYAQLAELPSRWRKLGREVPASEEHLKNCDAHFQRFVDFMRSSKPETIYLYDITPEDAAAFVVKVRADLAPATAQYGVRLVAKALSRFLPVGSANPFAEMIGRRRHGASGVIHREPFSALELRAILDLSRSDSFMYPLIVTAMCTGMRRADVCGLRWSSVDLAAGMISVKTGKTAADVEIPIFEPLRAVLQNHPGSGKQYVFPEAARMLDKNADGLSYRFKAIVARALDTKTSDPLPAPVPAAAIEDDAVAAIMEHVPDGKRRQRMLNTFHRYAAGDSVRTISSTTGQSKGTISYDLRLVESWTDKHFMRSAQAPSIKGAIDRITRTSRERGLKAASVKDWHALRTTFVTLALSAGVPMELVRRVTGHATVEVVLKHYFRPDRAHFKAALTGALPDVLTGPKQSETALYEELARLCAKMASGAGTEEDRKRIRSLAPQV